MKVANHCPKKQSWTWDKEAQAAFLALYLTDVDELLIPSALATSSLLSAFSIACLPFIMGVYQCLEK